METIIPQQIAAIPIKVGKKMSNFINKNIQVPWNIFMNI